MSTAGGGSPEELDVGVAGYGDWISKTLGEYSLENSNLRVYEKQSLDELQIEGSDLDEEDFYHIPQGEMLPPDEFYEDLDVLIVANRIADHGVQVLNARDKMEEDTDIIFEKALSNYPDLHRRLANSDSEEFPDIHPTLHYKEKASAGKAAEIIRDMDQIDQVEIVCKEDSFDEDRYPIVLPSEGGITWDMGPHAFELLLVNLDGQIPDNAVQKAKGIDTGTEFSEYPEAFAAEINVEGAKYAGDATAKILMGKSFEEDRKQFRIKGTDEKLGDWTITGNYGDANRERALRLELEDYDVDHFIDLSDEPSAKERITREWEAIGREHEIENELDLGTHADIMEVMDDINQEIGLYDEEGQMNSEPWNLEMENESIPEDFWESIRKVRTLQDSPAV